MQHLIINKTIRFILLTAFIMLSSCTTMQHESSKNTAAIKDTQSETVNRQPPEKKLEKIETSAPAKAENIWPRLFSLYQLPVIDNERIQAEINWYSQHPTYIKRIQENASPYLFHVVNEIEKRGIPGELALLPVVESAYRPFAYSHGRAAGLWQFIPSTGKAFGLKQ
ncbi:MAG: transglycosylase SLT domain-containing protein, partial [Cycloclasticus sp.]